MAGLVRALDIFGDLFILNLIYILFSLPVVTIGASTTALYSVTLRIVRNEDTAVWSGFVRAFKANFKKATALWGLVFLYAAILVSQYLLIINFKGVLVTVYTVIFFLTVALGFLVIPYLFPLVTRYENTTGKTIKNAFLIGVSHLGTSIKMGCLWFGSIMLSVMYPKIFLFTWYLWILIIFSLLAFLSSYMLVKIFDKLEKR